MNPILLRSLRWVAVGVAGLILAFSFALSCTFVYLAPALPSAENMPQMPVPLRVYTRTGGLIAQIGEERRILVEFEDIPMIVRQAVLAAEDDRFFEHSGFAWRGIVRALVMNVATADAGQGGSTITQQAARNLFLSLDKTMRRKLSEVFVTWRMERDFTKEQILATYLNVILFGQRSYGIAAAAETYYGRRLDELTVAQAATLAGIIQRPSAQNPITNARAAEARRAYVLRRMQDLGYIDSATAEAAAKESVGSRSFGPLIDVEAPYVAEMARQEIQTRFGPAAVNAGYRVYTTLDDRLQTAANRAVRLGLITYDRGRGYRGHLGTVELPSAPSEEELDALLQEFSRVNILEPAVVTAVTATTAEVHVRGRGAARIGWNGLSWAARAVRGGKAAAPRTAGEVVKRGDVVHVLVDGRGNAQLAQVPEAQSALVALDPDDGAVVSLTGGFDFYSNQFNRVTQANRQPGSSFKPFLYSAALDNGFTPASIILDAPILLPQGNSEENWRPENSTRSFAGPMRLREALVRSRNLVSIRILQDIGVDTLIRHAAAFGFDPAIMPRNATLALGTQTTTPVQMATGFAVFANGGFKVDWYFIERIEDADGEVVYQAEPKIVCAACEQEQSATAPSAADDVATVVLGADAGESQGAAEGFDGEGNFGGDRNFDAAGGFASAGGFGTPAPFSPAVMAAAVNGTYAALHAPVTPLLGMEDIPAAMRELASVQGGNGFLPEDRLAPRVLSAQNAWLTSDILHDVTARGTAQRTRAMGRTDLAGKTGTTNEGRDNWFNGFTPNLVASVWVGFDNNQSLGAGAEGSTTAVPIWMHYMTEALQGVPQQRLPRPEGLIDLKVSPYTGTLTSTMDPEGIVETFMIDTLPREPRPGEAGYAPAGETGGGASRGEPLF